MNRLRTAAFTPLVLMIGASALRAQEPAPDSGMVDGVVAVVGDSAILKTDLDEEVFRLVAQAGQTMPEDPAAIERLYNDALESKVNELLLLQAAVRDSILVQDADVAQYVDQEVARRRQALGGDVAFDDALRQQGMTRAEFRDEITQEMRRQRTVDTYMRKLQQQRRPPPVTDKEAREFFEAQQDRLGQRPATVSFQQVIVRPRPSDSARAAARARAEQVLDQLRHGADFAEMARRYTDEPGGRERAGDLGWFRRGQMVEEFERVAFSLPPGSTSGIVETGFGFHIIKVEKAKGAERQARHILFRPEISPEDLARTESIAREVTDGMRAGEPIDSLVAQYGDPDVQRQGTLLAARVDRARRDDLPEPYSTVLADVHAGQVLDPFRLTAVGEGNHWVAARITEVTEAGKYSWDDPELRSQVRERLEVQKLMDEVIRDLRSRTYIDIRN